MKMLFDIGDYIEIRLKCTVEEYEVTAKGWHLILKPMADITDKIYMDVKEPYQEGADALMIGGYIECTIVGKIIRYSNSRNGDCYTIEAGNASVYGILDRLYLTTDDLISMNTKKIDTIDFSEEEPDV